MLTKDEKIKCLIETYQEFSQEYQERANENTDDFLRGFHWAKESVYRMVAESLQEILDEHKGGD